MAEDKKLTGYPSIDKPWLKYFREADLNSELPQCSVYKTVFDNNKDYLKRYLDSKNPQKSDCPINS